jgi:hypothetical protein
MNFYRLSGFELDVHGFTHSNGIAGQNATALADCVGWHVKQFARLTKKLRDRKEADGSSILDHSALVLTFEGGHGFDPEGGSAFVSHSTENMNMLVAGRAGGLKAGQHVKATGKNPASVVLTAMRAVGVSGSLGEVSSTIPELLP